MQRRHFIQGATALAGAAISAGFPLSRRASAQAPAAPGKKGLMLLNRIGPSQSELYIANADGSGERKLTSDATLEYNARFSSDGNWVVFTSERNGDGQADIFRRRLDGTGLEPLVEHATMDDAGALSPDGAHLAFVSTRDGHRANIWIRTLQDGALRNLTAAPQHPGRSGAAERLFPARMVAGRPVDRILVGPEHRLAGPQQRARLGAYAGAVDLHRARRRRRIRADRVPPRHVPRDALLVARRSRNRLLRDDDGRHLGRPPPESGRRRHLADRVRQCPDGRTDCANQWPRPEDVSPLRRIGRNPLSSQGRRGRRALLDHTRHAAQGRP